MKRKISSYHNETHRIMNNRSPYTNRRSRTGSLNVIFMLHVSLAPPYDLNCNHVLMKTPLMMNSWRPLASTAVLLRSTTYSFGSIKVLRRRRTSFSLKFTVLPLELTLHDPPRPFLSSVVFFLHLHHTLPDLFPSQPNIAIFLIMPDTSLTLLLSLTIYHPSLSLFYHFTSLHF